MRIPKIHCLIALALSLQPLSVLAQAPTTDTQLTGIVKGKPVQFSSRFLKADITVLPGVFFPYEGENWVLPLLHEYADLFEGASVLEIGTGSGIISLYAAQLGAKKVVSTDINPRAVECATLNAKQLGLSSTMEVRLVPQDDISAYSVIRENERFDIIFSNPPYALDLDATQNSAVTDTGALGPSLIRGLKQHMAPGGSAILLYNSLFYHHVMIKFAHHAGYTVRNHNPNVLMPWEAQTLFNHALATAYERVGLERGDVGFHANLAIPRELSQTEHLDPEALDYQKVADDLGSVNVVSRYGPLFEGRPSKPHPGFMVIRRP